MKLRKSLQLGIGAAVAAFFVWLVVRQVDGAELAVALGAARPEWIGAAVALFLVGYVCRIRRWQLMLQRDNPGIGWITCATPFMASIAANNVLPFRAGDVLRALAFTRWLGVAAANVVATLLVERLLDLLTLLAVLALALHLLGAGEGTATALVGMGGTGLAAIAVAVCGALLFPQLFEAPARWAAAALGRIAPALGARATTETGRVFGTLRHLARGPLMMRLMLWSLAAWACEATVFYCAARAIPAMTEPLAALLAFPVGTLATLLPSTPGYIGTFDFFVIEAAQVLANPAAAAAAFAILVHAILWLTATLTGGAMMAAWALSQRRPNGQVPQHEGIPR